MKQEDLLWLCDKMATLRRSVRGGRNRPHKLVMLLAVLDLADSGRLKENKIFFSAPLLERFESQFGPFAEPGDWCQPSMPFFHLRDSGFWHHQVKDGRQSYYDAIRRVGGGRKLIAENIEFAFLDERAYTLFTDSNGRRDLRIWLEDRLREETVGRNRLGTSFHETFPLSLPAVSAILSHLGAANGQITRESLRSELGLGANYIRSMPAYARGAGLVRLGSFTLTTLGQRVLEADPHLTSDATAWVLHYHMSAPQGPGPGFWHSLVVHDLELGARLTRADLAGRISDICQTDGRPIGKGAAVGAAGAFLGTYARSDALGRLGLIEASDEGRGVYQVREPLLPGASEIAYALADYWPSAFGDTQEVMLKELTREAGFASLFFLGPGLFGSILSELQSAGVLLVRRDVPPFMVVRLWADGETFLERLYE